MLYAKAFAHAITAVVLALYIICRVASLLAPDFLFNVASSWFHTFNVDSLQGTEPMELGTFIFGGITLAFITWITTYTTIVLYNRWRT